ncbi:hypothetical protein SUGI_0012320 [Cryptomeria japonica]|uniref:uncharacterized protein LOC131041867 isoform X2 n=1 Tax=Cryptomeria japonica TaxID=3369 RepID=UPI002408BDC1|nr:uncharacterized protein LOC131041867 isoform X2 [Cryptomeria japonica]GLJ05154.1 hypothetical protein SUGI_0012320 [Cryptomeria japonica]
MPGSIRVSVLESVDLPPEATGGKYVSIKVSIGKKEFQTKPSEVNGGRTAAWNSNFAFPVLNLQDNLMVALLDSKGNAISQTEIGTPIIVEKGSLEEIFPLKGGGCVHLRLSFVLTLEERMKIEAMREAALEKKYRTVNKNPTTQVLNSGKENRTSALISGTVISQKILRDVISKDESYNEKNQITTIVVPRVSLPNEMQKKTETTERTSLAPISSPIENVIHKETSSHDLKDISDQNLEENGCQYLPVNELEEAAATVSSKELTPPIKDSSLLSDNTSFPKYESIEVVQENTLLANENIMLAQLPPVKDSLAELENSEVHNFTDKFSVIGHGQIEFEKKDTTSIIADMVVSETPIASSGSCLLPDSSDSHDFVNLDTQFHGGTPDMPSESNSLSGSEGTANSLSVITSSEEGIPTSSLPTFPNVLASHSSESNSLSGFDGTANSLSVITSSEEGIATSSLSTFPNVLTSHSSRDGSISLSHLVDSPGDATEEKTIPFPNISPKSTQLDQNFQLHQSIHSTEIPHASTTYDSIPGKEIITASHPDSDFCTEDLCTDQTSAIVINTENTQLLAQNICLAQSSNIDSLYKVSQSDTGNGSLSGKETEGVCEASSLQAVPCQPSSTAKGLTQSVSSNVSQLIDNKFHIVLSTSFPNPQASRTVIGDGRQNSVKAKIKVFESTLSSQTKKGVKQSGVKEKIKVFESSLSQDPDSHTISSPKTNHKIEALRARQRLQEEAASAEAAEARRRAEEEQAKMKSTTEERDGNKDFQKRQEELRFSTPAKLKRKDLERNEEGDKRQPQKDVKNITNSKEDIRTQTFREEEESTLTKHPKEKGKNLSRAIKSKETMTENDCMQRAVNWETMRLGELQLNRDFQGTVVKPDISAKENEVVEKSLMYESTKVTRSSKASEQNRDVGIQAGESQLIKPKGVRSVMEARATRNEKGKKEQSSNHDHIIEQTVHSMISGRSFAEDMSAEKDPTIPDEKLEDLVNGSTEFGGFIKQALSAAALLATGALLMWLRGETMKARRSRMAQPNNQHYFLPNEEATSRSLQGEFGEPNGISNFSPEDIFFA